VPSEEPPDAPSGQCPSGTTPTDIDQLRGLSQVLAEGRVTPRDARLWAGVTGRSALPESKVQASELYGVGARQAANIQHRVQAAIDAVSAAEGATRPHITQADTDASAILAAEVDLSAHPLREDALAALETLLARRRHQPIRRAHRPTAGAQRARRHRLRQHLDRRMNTLDQAAELSLAQPYLVLPYSLPTRLLPLVPAEERRRSAAPSEAWLGLVTEELGRAYDEHQPHARDLATVAMWGFARLPGALPKLEAIALRYASAIAREQGRISAYWFSERIRLLLGPGALESLYSAHDSAIALRNHGYIGRANRVLRRTLRTASVSDLHPTEHALLRCLLLSQVAFNQTYGRTETNDPRKALEAARPVLDAFHAANDMIKDPTWLAAAARSAFEWELRKATLRARNDRERPWLDAAAHRAYAEAERRIRVSGSAIWQAQWSLLVMRVGLLRRDPEQVRIGACSYTALAQQNQWIQRDHPGEQRLFVTYRQHALQRMPKLTGKLEERRRNALLSAGEKIRRRRPWGSGVEAVGRFGSVGRRTRSCHRRAGEESALTQVGAGPLHSPAHPPASHRCFSERASVDTYRRVSPDSSRHSGPASGPDCRMVRVTVTLPSAPGASRWPASVWTPGPLAVHENDRPGSNAVTRHTVAGSRGCFTRTALPIPNAPWSRRCTRVMLGVQSGHRSTSTSTAQTRSGEALTSTETSYCTRHLRTPADTAPARR